MDVKKELKQVKRAVGLAERNFDKEIENAERELKTDIRYAEKWMYQRKRFFIKLIWVIGLVAVLLIFSHLYLRMSGVGI
ncbi:MAG: hypothetical protein WCX73_01655 [Candidatus Pacearchaeota archaeon]|jgi:hypothetical protein